MVLGGSRLHSSSQPCLAIAASGKLAKRKGSLSRFYPSRSQSFPCLELALDSEHGDDALGLMKRRRTSSHSAGPCRDEDADSGCMGCPSGSSGDEFASPELNSQLDLARCASISPLMDSAASNSLILMARQGSTGSSTSSAAAAAAWLASATDDLCTSLRGARLARGNLSMAAAAAALMADPFASPQSLQQHQERQQQSSDHRVRSMPRHHQLQQPDASAERQHQEPASLNS